MKLNPKFTRGEYWILNSVVESAIPICWLDWENIEQVLNKSTHGMNRRQLEDTFLEMSEKGLIDVYVSGEWNRKVFLTPEKLDTAFDEKQHPKCLYYRLSPKGGIYWEAFALPNWNYYICEAYTEQDNSGYENGEIICLNSEVLKKYFDSLCYQTLHIEASSVDRNELQPWQATYWKKLPIGYSVQFKYRNMETQKSTIVPNIFDKDYYDKLWCEWR